MKRNILINQPFFQRLLEGSKIKVLDGGARGEIFKPFGEVNSDFLQIVKFEPDGGAEVKKVGDDLIYPKALWDSCTELELNIAYEPRCSSVFEFNEVLQEAIDPDQSQRKTAKKVKVPAVNLDSLIESGLELDFIKLDIHGAEYQVLAGATTMLERTLGLLIESWTIPVHIGQKLRCHVEALAYESGFYLFEEVGRANWSRKIKEYDKKQMVAVDSLFFKDPTLKSDNLSRIRALKLIGLAQLFSHSAYAIQLCNYLSNLGIISDDESSQISTFINENDRSSFVVRKIRKALIHINYFFSESSFK